MLNETARHPIVYFVVVLVLTVAILSPLLVVNSISYADNCSAPPGTPSSPLCNGGSCDCYIPYQGRGGHVWEGVVATGWYYTGCMVTWKSGCCDFC